MFTDGIIYNCHIMLKFLQALLLLLLFIIIIVVVIVIVIKYPVALDVTLAN